MTTIRQDRQIDKTKITKLLADAHSLKRKIERKKILKWGATGQESFIILLAVFNFLYVFSLCLPTGENRPKQLKIYIHN